MGDAIPPGRPFLDRRPRPGDSKAVLAPGGAPPAASPEPQPAGVLMSASPSSELLSRVSGLTRQELVALVRADQRRCWLRGERVPVEAYRDRLPRLRQDPEALREVVC